jgi:hypothetical protein
LIHVGIGPLDGDDVVQERPWTERYWQEHVPFQKGEVPPIVEPIREVDWMWFRGDRVEVLKGPDKGKQV